jgi:hypothetical protein
MTDHEIDYAARQMLTETVVRHVQPGSDEWLNLLARSCPGATITDREYIAMRVKAMIAEWQRHPSRQA